MEKLETLMIGQLQKPSPIFVTYAANTGLRMFGIAMRLAAIMQWHRTAVYRHHPSLGIKSRRSGYIYWCAATVLDLKSSRFS